MRLLVILFLLLPFLFNAQNNRIRIDTTENSGRINFDGTSYNILIGQEVGNLTSTGLFNTFIGWENGHQNSTGGRNVTLGSYAGRNNTTGTSNVNLGVTAGTNNTIGNGNVNIGDGAGVLDTDGSDNVYIGFHAGSNAIGSGNILIGSKAGFSLNGDNQLMISNTNTKPALLHGDFENDHLTINGDLEVTGNINLSSIDVSQITGILGSGFSAVFPVVLDNTVELEIAGISLSSNVLVVNTVGFEIDTFTIANAGCLMPENGFTMEFPLVFETADPSDISALNSWLNNPDPRDMSLNIYDLQQNETSRFIFYDYTIQSTEAGTDGRTRFTLTHNQIPNTSLGIDISPDFGSSSSYNPQTDKLVEISGVITGFNPEVHIDYSKRVITLESTYNEGQGLLPWIENKVAGSPEKRNMSVIETTDGTASTEISRENFFEVIPFKYEVIYGFGLNTKIKTRIQLLYGCNEPG